MNRWLYQGIRPRWIPLRWWSRAFTDGYRAACADVVSGFVDPNDPDGPVLLAIRPTSTPDAVVRPVRSDDDAKAVEGE